MVGDTEIYRTRREVDDWRANDPIIRLEAELTKFGIFDEPTLERERASIRRRIDEAEEFALNSPQPSAATALADVYG
jgi:TPP-dependent pyruvate/acetoin dehydrogenase alpha subunit